MEKNKKEIKTFSEFTNLYSLSKTLRFELKPVGKTQQMLDDAQVFKKDEIVQQNYEQIKPFFDELHRRFVQDALKDVYLDGLDAYYTEFEKEKKKVRSKNDENDTESNNQAGDKKKKISPLQKEEEKLRKAVVDFFIAGGNTWKKKHEAKGIILPNNGMDVLFGKETLLLLKAMFSEEACEIAGQKCSTLGQDYDGQPVNVFEWFLAEKFTTYFYRLHPSRQNFYSTEDKDTAIANRIVNENLRRFAENKLQYESGKAEYDKLNLAEDECRIFELDFYSSCLLQNGIDTYNEIIGGTEQKNGGKKGLNQKINEYNQEHKTKIKQFKKLYKQILSPKEKRVMNDIEEDGQVFPTLQKFIALNQPKIAEAEKLLAIIFARAEDEEFLKEVYFKSVAINTLSSKYFLSWETLKGALFTGKGEKKKLPDFVPLADIRATLLKNDLKASELFKDEYRAYFSENHWQTFLAIFKSEFKKSAQEFEVAKQKAGKLIASGVSYERDDTHNEAIKAVCDSALGVFQMIKYFALEKGRKAIEKERNEEFYEPFENYYGHDRGDFSREIVRMYDDFRNYLTKKPYSEEKWKLNFESATLLNGWDINKEPDNYGVVLREKSSGKFFLALPANKKENRIFDKTKNKPLFETSVSEWEKMEYKYLPGPNKMLPKVAFAKSNILSADNPKGYFEPSADILHIREDDTFKKGNEKFNRKDLVMWINYFKDCIAKYPDWSVFYFPFKPSEEYEDVSQFYRDVSKYGYKISFTPISHAKLQELNNESRIYIFEIHSKDFGAKADGKENLHTSYFKLLFDPANLASPLIKLSGEAEIFFRPASLKAEEEKRNFKRTIVKNKRYTENKVFLHCPIVLNFSTPEDKRINARLNAEIAKHKDDFHIIGIDRGEKHLAYYSVIDSDGKIVETGSFNEINGKDYHQKLVEMADKRNEARKDWKRIANIKELKTGYISQVVRKICDLILKYNAVVVLEDLNAGFKRGRSALDFPVYQKLELALAKKLNFLIQKDAKEGEIGHPLKALQLTPPVQNFQDINRQTGVLFYTTAGYTSTTCPRCGWRKNLYLAYENIEKAKTDFADIKITFEDGKFIFSYTSKTEKLEKGGKEKKRKVEEIFGRAWKLQSNVARYRGQKNKNGAWEVKPYENLTDNFKALFEKTGIDLSHPNITDEFIERGAGLGAEFWKSLIFYTNLLCQIRNSKSDESKDIISCPACCFHSDDSKDVAPIFTSDFAGKKEFNGDANGAYNIARKGLIMLERIAKHNKNDSQFKKHTDILITQYDWDIFLDSTKNS